MTLGPPEAPVLTADRVAIRLAAVQALGGRVRVARLGLERPRIAVRLPEGRGGAGACPTDLLSRIEVRELEIVHGEIDLAFAGGVRLRASSLDLRTRLAARSLRSLTARAEKRVLLWLAPARTSSWTRRRCASTGSATARSARRASRSRATSRTTSPSRRSGPPRRWWTACGSASADGSATSARQSSSWTPPPADRCARCSRSPASIAPRRRRGPSRPRAASPDPPAGRRSRRASGSSAPASAGFIPATGAPRCGSRQTWTRSWWSGSSGRSRAAAWSRAAGSGSGRPSPSTGSSRPPGRTSRTSSRASGSRAHG